MREVKTTMGMRVAVGIACLLISGTAMASPSGLNNIPTADVAPERTLVLQAWGTFASGSTAAWMLGAKYGLFEGLEVGLDSSVSSDDAGPLTAQAKYQIPGVVDKIFVQPVVGVANISGDTDDAGEIDPYVGLTYDAEVVRVHAGYSFQKDNHALYAGVDKTFEVMERDLMVRADIRQVSDGDEFLGSLGVLHVLPYNLIFEGWGSFPSESGAEISVTAKLNYVITF